MRRSELLKDVVGLIPGAHVVDPMDGWPGIVDLETSEGMMRTAIHIGPIGLGHRPKRYDVERRFQNPDANKPLKTIPGCHSFLVGSWLSDPLLKVEHPLLVTMAVTAERRTKLTRQSYFLPVRALVRATSHGWATDYSSLGERIDVYVPAAFPAAAQLSLNETGADMLEMSSAITASGLLEESPADSAPERVRRQTLVLARSGVFGRNVIRAYGGRCAMCGLNATLVEGAHIQPVSAPGTQDIVTNGICLCRNHHGAFDRHLIYVGPKSRQISFHPDVHAEAAASPAGRAFLASTYQALANPIENAHRPPNKAFSDRYEFFDSAYEWM